MFVAALFVITKDWKENLTSFIRRLVKLVAMPWYNGMPHSSLKEWGGSILLTWKDVQDRLLSEINNVENIVYSIFHI